IVRGVNVFPTQIEELILRIPQLSPHFQCVLTREGRMDELTVRVERREGVDAARATEAGAELAHLVKSNIGITVGVDVVEPRAVRYASDWRDARAGSRPRPGRRGMFRSTGGWAAISWRPRRAAGVQVVRTPVPGEDHHGTVAALRPGSAATYTVQCGRMEID